MLGAVLAITGYAMLATVSSSNIKYVAVFFGAAGAFPAGAGFLSWGVNNAAGVSIRAVSSAYIVSVGTVGAIVATWTYLPKDGPTYITGHTIILGTQSAVFVICVVLVTYVRWENGVRKRGGRDYRVAGKSQKEVLDLGYRCVRFISSLIFLQS